MSNKNTTIYWALTLCQALVQYLRVSAELILSTVWCGRCYYFPIYQWGNGGPPDRNLCKCIPDRLQRPSPQPSHCYGPWDTGARGRQERHQAQLILPFIMSFQEMKEEKSSYNCPLCEKICTTQHQLTMHIRQVCYCFYIFVLNHSSWREDQVIRYQYMNCGCV